MENICLRFPSIMVNVVGFLDNKSLVTVRPRTERFLGQKIPRSAQNSSVGGLLLCTDGQIQTRHVQLEVYCYLLSDPFSLRPTF